ncbi:coat protein [Metaplexis yellow mottle-associated virus]|uniref:Coat protein n=1 Tax=Metaplexis yellow mottle-associated virus TaxID=2878269 RepID=A0A8K1HNR3_9VIRU|nr:coat protein [Metaplexis yellow mottle-associated virus]UBN09109.1 coat protein [Metaplexis yellow mottle-associated virus]
MIKARLEKYFEETHSSEHMDQVVQMLSMTDPEIEAIAEQRLNVLVSVSNNKASVYEYDDEGSSYSRPTGSRPTRSHSNPYTSGSTKGYSSGRTSGYSRYNIPEEYVPMKKYTGLGKNLDLDCATNRRQLIEAWDNEMRLIVQTDDTLRDDFDLILTLAKNKTIGNARRFLDNLDTSIFRNGSGEDFLRHLTNSLFTVFIGKNYLTAGDREREREAEEARNRMVRLAICDLCEFESFFCDYETALMKIPLDEWPPYIESFIRKVPMVGNMVLPEYNSGDVYQRSSLAYAKELIKQQMEKVCRERQLKKSLRNLNLCCPEFQGPETMYGCNTPEGISRWKKKIRKKYKWKKASSSKRKKFQKKKKKGKFFKRRKRYSRNRELEEVPQGVNDPKERDKKKFCPQGKSTCKCWICNEVGHFAKDCSKKTSQVNKALTFINEHDLDYVYTDEELSSSEDELYLLVSDEEEVYESDSSSNSD